MNTLYSDWAKITHSGSGKQLIIRLIDVPTQRSSGWVNAHPGAASHEFSASVGNL